MKHKNEKQISSIISNKLIIAIKKCLKNSEQIILLKNKILYKDSCSIIGINLSLFLKDNNTFHDHPHN